MLFNEKFACSYRCGNPKKHTHKEEEKDECPRCGKTKLIKHKSCYACFVEREAPFFLCAGYKSEAKLKPKRHEG